MISLSHWGMFPILQKKYSEAWYEEQRWIRKDDL